jgi:hypothetical protein
MKSKGEGNPLKTFRIWWRSPQITLRALEPPSGRAGSDLKKLGLEGVWASYLYPGGQELVRPPIYTLGVKSWSGPTGRPDMFGELDLSRLGVGLIWWLELRVFQET